jgi:hypothetical protein
MVGCGDEVKLLQLILGLLFYNRNQ